MTTTEIVDRINKSVEVLGLDHSKPERIGSPSVGDVVRQGDLYLECLDDGYSGKDVISERQLVPGNTQGSRHVLAGDATVWANNPLNEPSHLIGPSFKCEGECTLEHPEHQDKILPPGSVWGTVYQRVGQEERRVRD